MFLKYLFLLFCEVQFFAFLAKICIQSEGDGFSCKKLNDIPGSKTTWSKREDSVREGPKLFSENKNPSFLGLCPKIGVALGGWGFRVPNKYMEFCPKNCSFPQKNKMLQTA